MPVTFTTSKDDQDLRIFIIEHGEKKPLSNDDFMREYNKLKRLKSSIKNALFEKVDEEKEQSPVAKTDNNPVKIDKEQR